MPMASEQTDQLCHHETVLLFNTTKLQLPIDQTQLQRLADITGNLCKVAFEMVEVVYVDANTIAEVNKTYLKHDYVTDIITFRLDEGDNLAIEGTIYCCVSRIIEQAIEYGQDNNIEFARIATHGFLHLSGMDDKNKASKDAMTRAEDEILTIWKRTT